MEIIEIQNPALQAQELATKMQHIGGGLSEEVVSTYLFDCKYFPDMFKGKHYDLALSRLSLDKEIEIGINKGLIKSDVYPINSVKVINGKWMAPEHIFKNLVGTILFVSCCYPKSTQLYIDDDGIHWHSDLAVKMVCEIPEIFTSTNRTKQVRNQKTYLMIDRNTGYYKVGKSLSPLDREKVLQSEKPTIELLYVCEKNVESKLHSRFKDKRIRGEWFDLIESDINFMVEKYNFKAHLNR